MKSKYSFLFLALYTGLFFLLFPQYRFVTDADATGYFSVAERMARGDYYNSINGMWSPLGSWILAPFIRWGFDAVITVKYLNGFYGLIILCSLFSLVKKLSIPLSASLGILAASVILVLHFVFLRLFGDLLQAMFLILYLDVVCSRDFYGNHKKILLAAFLGGLGFYAKAYTFYFILAHLSIVLMIMGKKQNKTLFGRESIKKVLTAAVTIIITVLPWAFILKHKYGSFMLSRTGTYNMTWSLSQVYEQPRVLFYPPPYADGYSIWDDPSFWNVTGITPFTNSKTFFFQLKLILSNMTDALKSLNMYSVFLIVILITALILFYKKAKGFAGEVNPVVLTCFIIVWPLGILLLHVETRFLWIMAVVSLLLAGVLTAHFSNRETISRKILSPVSFIIIASFCIYPLSQLLKQAGAGKDIYDMAAIFKKNNIGGNMISGHQNSDERSTCVVLNYLLKGKYFGPHEKDYSAEEILSGIEKFKIDSYILFYHSPSQKNEILKGIIASRSDKQWPDLYPGVIVLGFNQINSR